MEESEKLRLIYEEAYNFLKGKVNEDILKKTFGLLSQLQP